MARAAVTQNSINRTARTSFQLDGVAEIQERLSRIIDATTGREIKEVYLEGAKILADEARHRAPLGPTGRLKRAIFAARGDENKPNALAGVNYKIAPHAHFTEYGTVKMSARPYFRPAIATSKTAIASTIIKGFQKVIEKHGAS